MEPSLALVIGFGSSLAAIGACYLVCRSSTSRCISNGYPVDFDLTSGLMLDTGAGDNQNSRKQDSNNINPNSIVLPALKQNAKRSAGSISSDIPSKATPDEAARIDSDLNLVVLRLGRR